MKADILTIQKLFVEYKIQLSEKNIVALSKYCDFLIDYNKKVNLTAIVEPEEIWRRHFLDSIYPLTLADIPDGASLIDIGTGAGFPSVPMAIYRGDLKITMLDSLMKRITFLQQLAVKTGIENWQCVHGRAEDIGHMVEYREKYDVATARAVAPLPVLCEYCIPFVKPSGIFLALKGPNESASDAENAVKTLGGVVEDEILYKICGEERRLVVIRKISHTPTNYPRKSKRIQQMPL